MNYLDLLLVVAHQRVSFDGGYGLQSDTALLPFIAGYQLSPSINKTFIFQ